ncbi:hypothetical protein C8R45DRAFT_961789 [Mycena sanguinolenta]|nr:hypothetical protein C8R45DRAFT_961789 [Mycena sanguinolenta]
MAPKVGVEVWHKTTSSPDDDSLSWKTQCWASNFTASPRQVEYSVSGTPVNRPPFDFAKTVYQEIDHKFKVFTKELDKVTKKESTHGPSNSMWFFSKRSVFVNNSSPLDEGRASEYGDPYNFLEKLAHSDVRFNRIPEVLIYDYTTKEYLPLSFHAIHLLPPGIILNVTVTPRAYVSRKQLAWDFKLVNIKVVEKKKDDILASPQKMITKRHLSELRNRLRQPLLGWLRCGSITHLRGVWRRPRCCYFW